MVDVSVIMPARNAARTIDASIRSVLAQPSVAELIVVDDHSTDQTAEAARQVGNARVKTFSSPENGIAAALNLGLSKAAGEYIARCDADDLYPEDRLDWQLSWLQSHRDYIAISGGFRAISEDGKPLADLGCQGVGRDVTADLLAGNSLTHLCAWLMRADAVRQAEGARPWFKSGEDIDLQLRLARCGKVWHEPRVSYMYRLRDNSVTHQQSLRIQEFYKIERKTICCPAGASGL